MVFSQSSAQQGTVELVPLTLRSSIRPTPQWQLCALTLLPLHIRSSCPGPATR